MLQNLDAEMWNGIEDEHVGNPSLANFRNDENQNPNTLPESKKRKKRKCMGARHGKPTTVKHQRAKYLDRKQELSVEAGVAKVLLEAIESQALDIATQGFQIQNLCQTIEAKDEIIADLQIQLADRDRTIADQDAQIVARDQNIVEARAMISALLDVCDAKDQGGKGPGNSSSD